MARMNFIFIYREVLEVLRMKFKSEAVSIYAIILYFDMP